MTPLVPARVLIKGASSAVAVAPTDGPRADLGFERWLEHLLPERGLPVQMRNTGREGQRLKTSVCNWADEFSWSPDVVILNHGMYEIVNGVIPWQFERLSNTKHRHAGRLREASVSRIVRPAWRTGARAQRQIELRVNPLKLVSIDKQARELAQFLRTIRAVAQPLVLVMDLWTPAPPWTEWFVGITPRHAEMQKAIYRVVENMNDPEVRVFPLSSIVDPYGPAGVPDGMHFAAHVHEDIAKALALEIAGYAATQRHLNHPDLDLSPYQD